MGVTGAWLVLCVDFFFAAQIFKENKREWLGVLEESIQFCNASKKLFTGPHATQLHLVNYIIVLFHT